MCEKWKELPFLVSAPFSSSQSIVLLVTLLQLLSLCFFHTHFVNCFGNMPNITQNPHEATPLDYGLDCFLPAQQLLVDDFNISHGEASQRLLAIWQTQNALDRQEWDAQQEVQAQEVHRAREQQQQQDEEQARAQIEDQEAALQEERKKNHTKFLPFADMQISTSTPVLPSSLALRKLRKGEYCELYFFMNKGLADAHAHWTTKCSLSRKMIRDCIPSFW